MVRSVWPQLQHKLLPEKKTKSRYEPQRTTHYYAVHGVTVRLYQGSLSFVLVHQANPKSQRKKIHLFSFFSFSFYSWRENRNYLTYNYYKFIAGVDLLTITWAKEKSKVMLQWIPSCSRILEKQIKKEKVVSTKLLSLNSPPPSLNSHQSITAILPGFLYL